MFVIYLAPIIKNENPSLNGKGTGGGAGNEN
jgi:hypothetical protein